MIHNIIIYTISFLLVAISSKIMPMPHESSQAPNELPLADNELLTYERPAGCDDPVLTEATVKEIFYEAEKLLAQISHSGFRGAEASEAWIANPEHQVVSEDLQRSDIFYFRPELENMDEFDSYFGKAFSDDTLERFKTQLEIAEYDGKAAGINFSAGAVGSSMIIWELSRVSKIQQDEQNSTAVVTMQPYYIEYEYSLVESAEYIFEYSQEWGWRIVLDKLSDV